jgi:hypothetical protein
MRAYNISFAIIALVAIMNLLATSDLTTANGAPIFPTQSAPPFTLLDSAFEAVQPKNITLSQQNMAAASDQPVLAGVMQYMGYFIYPLRVVNFLINTILMSTLYFGELLNTLYLPPGWCGTTKCEIVPSGIATMLMIFVNILHLLAIGQFLSGKDVRAGA